MSENALLECEKLMGPGEIENAFVKDDPALGVRAWDTRRTVAAAADESFTLDSDGTISGTVLSVEN